MKIYCYRYMWKLKDSASLNFKVLTDTEEGLLEFEKNLLVIPNLELAGKEYLHEMECEKLAQLVKLTSDNIEVKEDVK